MDREIVRSVLRSSGKFMESLPDEKHLDEIIGKIPVIDQNTSAALSTSLTDLMTYKISPEAYQRYSVRINLIETLREWIQPPIGLTSHQAFSQSDNVLQLCQGMMKKYFLNADFADIVSSENFFIFGRELINLADRNPLYIPYVKSLIEKIMISNMPFDNHELVESLLNHTEKFQLEFSLIEKLYIFDCVKLIEEPLIDCFLGNSKNMNIESFITTNNFDKLMNYAAKSPKIFQIISSILKTLYVHLEYSTLALDYVKFVLKKIIFNREDDKKYILDLYPMKLQPCVTLLNINPSYHTENSKELILQSLKNIYLEDTNQVLILLMHFPEWLHPLLNYASDVIY
ncbi:hypothetical protein PV325_012519 [Microctonus aethiopoides]|uniref:Uncharacterized protein n=1 Tax=Microctonus aethiopoides TaxID=144406 RepID=A0AA39F907_9HYME|nr:hypothetical protein PV325_012519 [Microctonus aethiopoides]KAK0092075.1 hypothetical protein PV326_002252 [Microctonus aethiopoides]KAK0165167.1 hypothetical protein PV328_003711 [Microctonus aethiopoides]